MKYVILIILSVSIFACQPKEIFVTEDAQKKLEVITFAKKISRLVSINNQAEILKNVEPEFLRKELAFKFASDTTEFLNKLFCGNIGDEFKCFKFEKILQIDLVDVIEREENKIQLYYEVANESQEDIMAEIYITKIDTAYFMYVDN